MGIWSEMNVTHTSANSGRFSKDWSNTAMFILQHRMVETFTSSHARKSIRVKNGAARSQIGKTWKSRSLRPSVLLKKTPFLSSRQGHHGKRDVRKKQKGKSASAFCVNSIKIPVTFLEEIAGSSVCSPS